MRRYAVVEFLFAFSFPTNINSDVSCDLSRGEYFGEFQHSGKEK